MEERSSSVTRSPVGSPSTQQSELTLLDKKGTRRSQSPAVLQQQQQQVSNDGDVKHERKR
jgi:hypothetical protein